MKGFNPARRLKAAPRKAVGTTSGIVRMRVNLGRINVSQETIKRGGWMSGTRLCMALLAVLIFNAFTCAQKNELAGGIGRTLLNDQAIQPGATPLLNNFVRFGSGTTFEINYARHLKGNDFARLDLEVPFVGNPDEDLGWAMRDRKSTRLNSSHSSISYAVFCLKKKKKTKIISS